MRMFRVAVWFPEPQAALDIDVKNDRLMSGVLSGAAELRRRQLQDAGLHIHTIDVTHLQKLAHDDQLRAVAEAVTESCSEAAAWLSSSKTAKATAASALKAQILQQRRIKEAMRI